ncbi:MAG: hypothetical protein NC321_09720 [Clostridium sp.]|nr:hypothetical protein [Clostridium sp.]
MPNKNIETGRQPAKQIPVEKKMKLAQYIRAENMDNRMKIRQREKILYGTESALPLWDKGDAFRREDYLWTDTPSEDGPSDSGSTFRLRMAAAILLFIGFLLCDAGEYKVFGYSMNDIHAMITEDTLLDFEK